MSNYLPKYIYWLILHKCAYFGTKYSKYTKFQYDGSKQWSNCHCDNQFKFYFKDYGIYINQKIIWGVSEVFFYSSQPGIYIYEKIIWRVSEVFFYSIQPDTQIDAPCQNY